MSPVVVITGASGGVGRACVREFAAAGYDVALLARGRAGLEAAAAEVEQAGQRALLLPTDVAHWAAVSAAAAKVEADLGPIEIWINAAFTAVFAKFIDIEPEEFARVTDV